MRKEVVREYRVSNMYIVKVKTKTMVRRVLLARLRAAPPFQGWGLNWSQLVPSAWDCLDVCIAPSEILSMGACY